MFIFSFFKIHLGRSRFSAPNAFFHPQSFFTPAIHLRPTPSARASRAFTLVEILVAMFILMIVIIGSTGIYTYSIKAQRRTAEMTLVSQDIQFLMATFSRNIRSSYIDYAYYGGSIIPETALSELALYDPENNKGTVYKQIGDQAAVCFCPNRHCRSASDAAPDCVEDSEFAGLTTHRLAITAATSCDTPPCSPSPGSSGLKFFISPASDPFSSPDPIQPRVTISLNANGAGENLTVQQTIPQRFFERR